MKRSLFLLPALFLAGVASAQDAFDLRVADVGLLQAKVVQTELGITTAQRAKMNAAADAHKKRLEEYDRQLKATGAVNPDKAKLLGLFHVLQKEVDSVLTPAQLTRLRELTLQRVGLISMTDDAVAKRIGISPTQVGRLKTAFNDGRAKFTAVQNSVRGPILAPYQGKKPKSQAEATAWRTAILAKLKAAEPKARPQLEAIGKATDASMLAVLTPAQQKAWTALKGRPFKAK